jgi:16S rRNA (uracil1498-N3)-methyltransferase
MKRFILTQAPAKGGVLRLTGADYHYLVRVRRLAPGESFPARLPGGGEVLIQVLAVDGGILTGRCVPGDQPPERGGPTLLPPLILYQALPRGAKMDLIVRQAAEGGVAEIIPFISEHSVPKPAEEGPGNRFRRWETIIREARQQSGSPIATSLKPPLTLEGLFDHWEALRNRRPQALGLLFHQSPLEQTSLHQYLGKGPDTVVLTIGPEGGFSPGEVSRFLAGGFKPLTIGDTVLRTETAALYGAAAVRTILLERASWLPNPPLPSGNGSIY